MTFEDRLGAARAPFVPLAEIREEAAQGEIARLYEEIRATLGQPIVNYVYRHLATIPGALPWAWRHARPLFASGWVERSAQLVEAVAQSRLNLLEPAAAPAGVLPAAAAAMVAAYNRANPRNLVVVEALRGTLEGRSLRAIVPPAASGLQCLAPSPIGEPLPPLPSADSLPAKVRAAIELLGARGGRGDPRLPPSLYRHLGHWPVVVAKLARSLLPLLEDERFEWVRAAFAEDVRALVVAAGPPGAPAGTDPPQERIPVETALRLFADRIGEMTLVGRLILPPGAAQPESKKRRA